jgi:hypothetical protein
VGLVLGLAVGLTGCSGGSGDGPEEVTEPTPIDAYVPDGISLSRTEFCDRIPEAAVERAVGADATTSHYGNGDTAAVTDGVEDVAHEFGCGYAGPGGETARAWLFAPPVTPVKARALVEEVRRTDGCRPVAGHGFGQPGTGSVCVADGRIRAAYRGLFGDAWFACELGQAGTAAAAARRQLLQDAGEWCVSVVESLRTAG